MCSLVETYGFQEGLAVFVFVIKCEDGGSTFLCNISAILWDCTTSLLMVTSTRTSNITYLYAGNFQELDVGLANGIRAMNITHTGELGYVLYIPNEVCDSHCDACFACVQVAGCKQNNKMYA
jgi:hypothetical protein